MYRSTLTAAKWSFRRSFATAIKPNIKLLAKLRQETEVSMAKAKEALVKNDNDYDLALNWLNQDALTSGAKKAAKVADRVAGEGLVSTASVNARSTIVELNCETDFVSRNSVFKNLASRIAATSLLIHEPVLNGSAIEEIPVSVLMKAPLMPHSDHTEGSTEDLGKTVEDVIVKTIGILGENITLRRAAVVNHGVSASYIHGGDGSTGKIGGLAVLEVDGDISQGNMEALTKSARQVARQAVGFNPKYAREQDVPAEDLEQQTDRSSYLKEVVLSNQAYLMNPEQCVSDYITQVAKDAGFEGARLLDFVRWEAGENIEKRVDNFTDDVMKAARGE
ncbi:elongation factor TS-domain-containing protein [Halteromyces radiatus]|uniref:elongation factor TS-domain-containing protein n=1 Tax=Halteromyces radiatus TaxID=101107 RepID=UPI00221F0FDC|nr:elongation factor TS-domain-containing protein [Halteromyces radiatus]KAI8099221.1 elongation factor TS-domain-containing protein [Halteromyces radiatus]